MRLETASRAMRRMWLAVKDGESDARGDAAEALCGLRRARFLDIDHDDLLISIPLHLAHSWTPQCLWSSTTVPA